MTAVAPATLSHRLRLIDPFVLGAIVVFLVLGFSLAFVKAPWCDEAWFVNPAYNLAFHGHLANMRLPPGLRQTVKTQFAVR